MVEVVLLVGSKLATSWGGGLLLSGMNTLVSVAMSTVSPGGWGKRMPKGLVVVFRTSGGVVAVVTT